MALLFAVIVSHSKSSLLTVNGAALVSHTSHRCSQGISAFPGRQHQHWEITHGHLFSGVCPSRITLISENKWKLKQTPTEIHTGILLVVELESSWKKNLSAKYQTNIKKQLYLSAETNRSLFFRCCLNEDDVYHEVTWTGSHSRRQFSV